MNDRPFDNSNRRWVHMAFFVRGYQGLLWVMVCYSIGVCRFNGLYVLSKHVTHVLRQMLPELAILWLGSPG